MNRIEKLLTGMMIIFIASVAMMSCKASAATNKHELKKEMKHMDHSRH